MAVNQESKSQKENMQVQPPGTEFFDAETKGPNPSFCLAETDAETRTNSKKPAVHGTNARITRGVRYLKTGWWCAQSDTNRSPTVIP